MNKQQLIESLALQAHIEGGYFKRRYQSPLNLEGQANGGATRPAMSSIYYLLTDDSPIGRFHKNRSDIVHYWQLGAALRYWLISPSGELTQVTMGPDLDKGQQLQLTVPGGFWKASELLSGEYGLISEAVCPGFDYADMTLAQAETIAKAYPQHWPLIAHLFEQGK